MKKLVLSLAVCAASVGSAHAQSSVTVFGVIDVAVRQTRNGHLGSIWSQVSGSNTSSRFGVRGTEDLGGGLRASFWLEASVAPDSGGGGSTSLAGQFWDRNAILSLSSNTLGELRLGLDYTPTFAGTWGPADPFGHVGIGSSGNLYNSITQAGPMRDTYGAINRNESTAVRSRNMVQYFLPAELGGFNGMVYVAPGEGGTPATGNAKNYGGRFGYTRGPLDTAVALVKTRTSVSGNNWLTDVVLYGAYDFGVVKVSSAWRQFKFTTSKEKNLMFGLWVPVGAGTFMASYGTVDMSGTAASIPAGQQSRIDPNDATQFAVGYKYDLSKRTRLYGTFGRISNKGQSFLSIAGGPAVTAATFAGQASQAFEFGVNHRF